MTASQKRAIRSYRSRLTERGLSRFEVLGLDADRDLIRKLARRLAESGPEAERIRASVELISADQARRRSIAAALRRSPLVGETIDISRAMVKPREVDL